ncbi:MAG: hypothetical protein AAFN78_03890 [Pseudomonadota bacterium]
MTDINDVEQTLWEQRRLSPTTVVVRAVLALVAAFVTILLTQKAVNNFSGPDRYLIVMAGDFDDGESSASFQLRDRLNKYCSAEDSDGRLVLADSNGVPLALDGRSIEFFEQNHIAGNAALTAEAVAARDDTLMVVGHFSSTASSKSLPVYLSQSPAVPVMLTVETNPKLTDFAGAADQPVVRLWPTDKVQAESAADFAVENHEKFWVVRDDSTNPVYSGYLADEFTRKILTTGRRVVLRSEIRTLPAPQLLRGYDVDAVFFPGGWEDSLMLIQTVRDAWGADGPSIFLTDAAADEKHSLATYGGVDVDGIFITHPAEPDVYMAKQVQVGLGETACEQIRTLVGRATKSVHEYKPPLLRVFHHHSLTYARQAVVEAAKHTPAVKDEFFVWNASESNGAIVFNDPVSADEAPHATASLPQATDGTTP